ncbi:hypothetical protein L1887_49730 [Cichorium endivia]|nr:hypothetical protein L1887_49730 [Cichorium endivia]
MHKGDLLEVGSDADDEDESRGCGGVRGGLDGRFDTRALHGDSRLYVLLALGDVLARSAREDLADLGGRLERRKLGIHLVRECARDDLLRKVETVLNDVGDDDGCSARSRCAEQLNDTDGTGASDEHRCAERDLGLQRGLERDRERLEQRDLLVRHVVRNLVQPSGRVLVVALERAVLGRHTVKVDGGTQVVLARTAVVARCLEARHTRLDRNTVARLDVVNPLADGHHDAARLVAERTLVLDLPRAQTGVLPEVHVRTTHTRGTHVHQRHTGLGRGRSRLDQLELLLGRSPASPIQSGNSVSTCS